MVLSWLPFAFLRFLIRNLSTYTYRLNITGQNSASFREKNLVIRTHADNFKREACSRSKLLAWPVPRINPASRPALENELTGKILGKRYKVNLPANWCTRTQKAVGIKKSVRCDNCQWSFLYLWVRWHAQMVTVLAGGRLLVLYIVSRVLNSNLGWSLITGVCHKLQGFSKLLFLNPS